MYTIPYIESDEFFYLDVFLKLLLGLLALALIINKSGKGNLAPTSAMDQVQNYVLGGIIGGVIYSPSVSIFQFAVVLFIWAFLIFGLRQLKTKNHAFRRFIDGAPVIVINRGKINIEACKKAKITAHELAFKLRREGVYYIREVKRAVLEQNGELIIVLVGEENPKYPIITDGIIQKSVLEDVDKNEEWLLEELQKAGYNSPAEVFLAEYENGSIKVIPYAN
ncbi:uncharacterized membrane protein YcaP (DUF421 family) [Capnocytophaga leadbetteri]|uniref:Uncharacterized membrane protein YcaP (DUF421 family) n=1 Tax=Capnocytophaga leadbetteri TaxID=327575 RepID=A0A2T5XRJ7_9FLAO|nr:DUF421 domain-containing protein [Capnocytophaga leadbetteri]PTX00286.1 uncharacterized membrane protein YcaP (DUF421 family) [Capnocytophaga leadbetteri]